MTIDETIKYEREKSVKLVKAGFGSCAKEHEQLVDWLEELKTLKKFREAIKPDYEGDGYYDGDIVYDTWICPTCGGRYEVDYDNYDYCPSCGQRIDLTLDEECDDETLAYPV